MLRDSFTYPIRDGGWISILVGAIFFVILEVFQMAPVLGILVAIFAFGYFGSFYLSIVGSTMTESDTLPHWPSFSSFLDDILAPFLRLIGLLLLAFAPTIGVLLLIDDESSVFPPACLAALVFGLFYFPMAVLASCAFGSIFAALPHVVFPGIFRAMPVYFIAVLVLAFVFVVSMAAQEFLLEVPYVGWFIAAVISLYSLIFQARLIGLIYRKKHEALGWG